MTLNSLTPGRSETNFRHVIFKQILVIDDWGICCEIALIWKSLDFTDDQSTLVQVMAWCRQATSHYLSQCWPRSLSPSDVTRPQWFNNHSTIRYRSTHICIPVYVHCFCAFENLQRKINNISIILFCKNVSPEMSSTSGGRPQWNLDLIINAIG